MTSDSSQELKQAPWSKQDAEREKDSDSNPVGSIPVVVAKFEFRGNFATDSRLKRDGYWVPSSGRRGIIHARAARADRDKKNDEDHQARESSQPVGEDKFS